MSKGNIWERFKNRFTVGGSGEAGLTHKRSDLSDQPHPEVDLFEEKAFDKAPLAGPVTWEERVANKAKKTHLTETEAAFSAAEEIQQAKDKVTLDRLRREHGIPEKLPDIGDEITYTTKKGEEVSAKIIGESEDAKPGQILETGEYGTFAINATSAETRVKKGKPSVEDKNQLVA